MTRGRFGGASAVAARAAIAALAIAAAGCAKPPPRPPVLLQPDWTRARGELASMRGQVAIHPYVEVIRVALREPRTGRVLEGRGAVAVDPRRAMRMILVGPGGRTALDVWLTHDAWRFSVPALDLTQRGDRRKPTYDVPIGFFRWWFLEPLEGRLLTVVPEPGRDEPPTFVLRDDGATVLLRELPERGAAERAARGLRHFVAERREDGDLDRLEWVSKTLRPGAGDRARYQQRTTGLEVEVLVEEVSQEPPDPAAFIDPDDRGVSL